MSFEKRWIVTKKRDSNQERMEAKIGAEIKIILEKMDPN
jgi:hypothetical protein